MDEIKVSICIITYNQEDFIRECLDGAVMQIVDFRYEIIIGEDCSTDKTLEICTEYAAAYPRLIKIFKSDINLGMQGNWINSIQNCEGKYIALCEGDDYWTDRTKLQKQVDFLDSNSDYVLCFHPISILQTDGKIVDDFITRVPENYEDIATLARLGNYIHTPSVVFRNVIKEFPFEFKHTPIGDFFLYLMLAEHGKLKCLEEKMCVYRYGVGVFSGASTVKMAQSNLKLFSCLASYLKNEEIKKIIFERQLKAASSLEKAINDGYKEHFISKNIFFKAVKFIQENYQEPAKIMRKIKMRIFKF